MFKAIKETQITRYSTSKETITYPKTSIVTLQRKSFKHFLTEGIEKIKNEFQNRNGKLRLKAIAITPPTHSELECFERGLSYDARITATFESNNTDKPIEYATSPYLLHYMTNSGAFIVKGVPRVFITSLASKKGAKKDSNDSDLDHLKNKNALMIGDLLITALRKALDDFFKKIYRTNNIDDKIDRFFVTSMKRHVGAVFRHFDVFSTFDTCNPLAMLSNLNMVTSQGIYGVPKHLPLYKVRDIHSSHYGRLCPIETPEGQNAGLVHHFASYVSLKDRQILTPYKVVSNGKLTDEIVTLTPEEENSCYIMQVADYFDEYSKPSKAKILARHEGKIKLYDREQITHQDIARGQILATSSSLIPFLEHDDGHRAVMASSMQKQAVPLVNPEIPIIGTGEEAFVAEETNGFPFLPQDYAISKGELALGKNLLVAYLPWDGYNYEDAIVVSSELVDEDIFTSLERFRISYSLEGNICDGDLEEFTRDIPNTPKDKLAKLDKYGFIKVGSQVNPGDVLIGKRRPKSENNNRISVKIFGNTTGRDTSLRADADSYGKVIAIEFLDQDKNTAPPEKAFTVIITIEQRQKLTLGDKLAGRHGNKGVIAKIVPKEKMPRLKTGEHIQIILNPLGIPSRMNVGQLYEAHLGWVAKVLGEKIKKGELASDKLVPLFGGIPDIVEYKTGSYAIPMAIPPFNAPSLKEIQYLYRLAGLDTSFKTELINSETDKPYTHPVTVGISYMLKLHHMVDDKIHARSTGKYAQVTEQPLQGRSNEGGQRLGEMEMWALEGHGAIHNLQECLTIKSDDVEGRNEAYAAILKGENIEDYGIPETFKYLVKIIKSLALDITVLDKRNNIINLDELSEEIKNLNQEENQNDKGK